METLQKFSMPLAIVVAGALIAVALYFSGGSTPAVNPNNGGTATVEQEIRGVQADDHILGNPEAKVVIVEYSDTECPFCKQFHNTLHQIMTEYGESGDVAWVYRNFPLQQLHPKAPKEAEALECAAELGGNDAFWKFTDLVYSTTNSNNSLDIGAYNVPKEVPVSADGTPYYTQSPAKSPTDGGQLTTLATSIGLDAQAFEECLASGRHAARVQSDLNEVAAAGGQGTPHSIILVGEDQIPVEGAQPYNVVKALIDTLVK